MKRTISTATGPARLTMRWVPVATADGRTRMEMRWSAPVPVRRATPTA